jgi:hypothetical protein
VQAVVNKTQLWKLKTSFASTVSKMLMHEVYGKPTSVCCSWEKLYQDYLIIEILEKYKQKCQNFCCDYGTFLYNGNYYFVVDNCFGNEISVGDYLTVTSDSEDFIDVDYEVTDVRVFPDINAGLYSAMLGAGFSTTAMIVTLSGVTITEVSEGKVSLRDSVVIDDDNMELTQEDIDCLIKKLC